MNEISLWINILHLRIAYIAAGMMIYWVARLTAVLIVRESGAASTLPTQSHDSTSVQFQSSDATEVTER